MSTIPQSGQPNAEDAKVSQKSQKKTFQI